MIRRWIKIWLTARKQQVLQKNVTWMRSRELEFLPAVLEVQETPPSPAGRAIILLIILLFIIAIAWASFGKMDIVAIAKGKIVLGDRSKVIQPFETGIVKSIHVSDGQSVTEGELLIEIDTMASADRERLLNEHMAALTEVARLRALIARKNTFIPPKGADPGYIRIQRQRLKDQLAEMHALDSQVQSFKKLYDKKFVSELQYLEAERKRAEKAQQNAAAFSDVETRAKSLGNEVSKAETRARHQRLTAPINGVVQQLAVHTVGGVVTPAQQLLVIAPTEGQLEVEAWVENKDIGFVNAGQEVEIKIDAFPFTRYGTIPGTVTGLSADAVPLDKIGYVYAARVSLERSTVKLENKTLRLTPGMTVSVEVKTGKRRLIEFFLSPLIRGFQESARER